MRRARARITRGLQSERLYPERHCNLSVRVWGWCGCLCELDDHYQERIIARQLHALQGSGGAGPAHAESDRGRPHLPHTNLPPPRPFLPP